MKVILSILLTIGLVSCEVPPPYQDRGFRPSPPFNLPSQSNFNNVRQPQIYGAPDPPKQTLPPIPQTQYGVPNTQNVEPLEGQLYKPPNLTPNFISKQTIPSTSYGVPAAGSNFKIVNSLPQTPFVPPSRFTTSPSLPQEQYGVPNTRNIETLDQIRQLQLLLQAKQASQRNKQNQFGVNFAQSQNSNRETSIPTTQYLPARGAENFNNFQQAQNSDRNLLQFSNSNRNVEKPAGQYLPVKETNNFRDDFQSPQFNRPNFLDFGESAKNQEPVQQYLPVKEPLDFGKGYDFAEASSPRSPNFNIPSNNLQVTSNRPDLNGDFGNGPPQKNQDDSSNANIPSNQYLSNAPPNFQNIENNPNFNGHNLRGNPQNIGANEFQQSPSNTNFKRPQQFSTVKPLNPQRNVEIQRLDVRLLNRPNINNNGAITQSTQIALPVQQNSNFGRSNSQQTNKEATSDKYLPPSTIPRSTVFQQTNRPTPTPTPQAPTEAPEEEEQSTVSDEEAGGPNIAVATAVAGAPGGQTFYLLQPDGRLQRVIYQRNRNNHDQENEYTANYHFQNIQADPNLVYSPLIRLGK